MINNMTDAWKTDFSLLMADNSNTESIYVCISSLFTSVFFFQGPVGKQKRLVGETSKSETFTVIF